MAKQKIEKGEEEAWMSMMTNVTPVHKIKEPTQDVVENEKTENREENVEKRKEVDVVVVPVASENISKDTGSEKPEPEAETDKDLSLYDKKYLSRSIIGFSRANVGISQETLNKIEKVVARVFDSRIAISTYIDNIITDHLMRNKKNFDKWLAEKPRELF